MENPRRLARRENRARNGAAFGELLIEIVAATLSV